MLPMTSFWERREISKMPAVSAAHLGVSLQQLQWQRARTCGTMSTWRYNNKAVQQHGGTATHRHANMAVHERISANAIRGLVRE